MQRYRGVAGVSSRRLRKLRSKRLQKLLFFQQYISSGKLAFYALIGLVGFIVLLVGYFFWVSRDLPTPGKLLTPDIKDSTTIADKNGELLFSVYKDYNRIYVPLNQIPEDLIKATISIEEKNFYENQGYSVAGYLRVIKDFILKGRLTGGSTITQQLVKNVLLTSERSITRKAKELILAIQVEQRFSKDEIIEMYLNNVPYGGSAIGVEAASNLYFDKQAKDLTFSESVFLAGLPQAPSYYSPYSGNDKAYIGRAKAVLKRMVEDGHISKAQFEKALGQIERFTFTKKQGNIKAPHFVMYVRQQLIDMFGEALVENGNLEVITTLDYEIQKNAEDIVFEELEDLKGYKVGNGSAIVLDPKTGAILAMVGSKDYFDVDNDGNFNASTSLRQPGSSLKPVVYATAFEKGYTPSTLVMDVPTEFPTYDENNSVYKPVNYDGKYRGPVQLRFALANSLNVPAVKVLAMVGIQPVMQQAYLMGIENWEATQSNISSVGLSLVLGGREASLMQIVSAYSAFANKGIRQEPFAIKEVRDGKGKKLYERKDSDGEKVLSEDVAFLISHILLDNNARSDVFGPNSFLNIPGRSVAVKTGTTDDKRDNWAIGYTPSYVVGTWVGNNDNSPMNPSIASGVTGATPIWRRIMIEVLDGTDQEEFEVPEGVVALEIDAFGGGLPFDGQVKRSEYFVKGTEPSTVAPLYKTLKLSKHDDGKLASDQEVERADYNTGEFIVFEENDPVSQDGENRWQKGIDEWLKQTYSAEQKQYYPPTEKSGYTYSDEDDEEDNLTPTVSPSP